MEVVFPRYVYIRVKKGKVRDVKVRDREEKKNVMGEMKRYSLIPKKALLEKKKRCVPYVLDPIHLIR